MVMFTLQRQIAKVMITTGLRGAGGRFLPGSPFTADSGKRTTCFDSFLAPAKKKHLSTCPGRNRGLRSGLGYRSHRTVGGSTHSHPLSFYTKLSPSPVKFVS